MDTNRKLTPKEIKVINTFEKARPGLGIIAEQNIRSDYTGWREIIEDMDESEIVVKEGRNESQE